MLRNAMTSTTMYGRTYIWKKLSICCISTSYGLAKQHCDRAHSIKPRWMTNSYLEDIRHFLTMSAWLTDSSMTF
jgi:hypothetical protein